VLRVARRAAAAAAAASQPLSGIDPGFYMTYPWLLDAENNVRCRNPDVATFDRPWCAACGATHRLECGSAGTSFGPGLGN